MPVFHFHTRSQTGEEDSVDVELPHCQAAWKEVGRACVDYLQDEVGSIPRGTTLEFDTVDDDGHVVGRIRVEAETFMDLCPSLERSR